MRHLLILQLVIVNLVGFSLAVWAWPYIQIVFASDTSHISQAIVVLWAFGLASCFVRAVKISRMLDQSKTDMNTYNMVLLRYRSQKAGAKNDHLSFLATTCAALGMFGTVVGLIVLARSIGDITADNVAATIAHAFSGFSIALGTTAVGAVCGIWLEVMALFIGTATKCAEVDLAG
jgi:biopolymer transport protein ExbB/TolQ